MITLLETFQNYNLPAVSRVSKQQNQKLLLSTYDVLIHNRAQ